MGIGCGKARASHRGSPRLRWERHRLFGGGTRNVHPQCRPTVSRRVGRRRPLLSGAPASSGGRRQAVLGIPPAAALRPQPASRRLRRCAWPDAPAPRRPGRSGSGTGRPAAAAASAVSIAANSPRISSMWRVRVAPFRPSRSSASTSPSARPRCAASWYSSTSSKTAPRIARLLADVVVAAVAGAADDDRAAPRRQRLHRGDQRAHRVGVVAVVGDHRRALVVHHVEAARHAVGIVDEARQPAADRRPSRRRRPTPRRPRPSRSRPGSRCGRGA